MCKPHATTAGACSNPIRHLATGIAVSGTASLSRGKRITTQDEHVCRLQNAKKNHDSNNVTALKTMRERFPLRGFVSKGCLERPGIVGTLLVFCVFVYCGTESLVLGSPCLATRQGSPAET